MVEIQGHNNIILYVIYQSSSMLREEDKKQKIPLYHYPYFEKI